MRWITTAAVIGDSPNRTRNRTNAPSTMGQIAKRFTVDAQIVALS